MKIGFLNHDLFEVVQTQMLSRPDEPRSKPRPKPLLSMAFNQQLSWARRTRTIANDV